jgi:hypothetical protein
VLDLDVRAPADFVLEQLRFVGWELRVRAPDEDYIVLEPSPSDIYYRVSLQPGRYRLQLRQVGTQAGRAGEAISWATLAVLLILAWRIRHPRSVALKPPL